MIQKKSAEWSRCRGGSGTSGVLLPQVVKKVQGRACNESAFYSAFSVSLFSFVLVMCKLFVGSDVVLVLHHCVVLVPLSCAVPIGRKKKGH